MSTTTIRLPDELKQWLAQAVKRSGTTAHAFMLDAIAEKLADVEQRSQFHQHAEQRLRDITASGMTIPWSEMRSYLELRRDDQATTRPVACKLPG